MARLRTFFFMLVASVLALLLPSRGFPQGDPLDQKAGFRGAKYNGHHGHGGGGDHDGDDDDDDDGDHHGKHRRVEIILQEVAVSAWEDGTSVGAQLQLKNVGKKKARSLRVTRLRVTGGSYEGPATLPLSLGDLPGGDDKRFDALLQVAAADGSVRWLTLSGDYREKDHHARRGFRLRFKIRPNAGPLGPIVSRPGVSAKQTPAVAIFPPNPPRATFGPNAESPVFVPLGPPRQLFPPTPTGTALGTSAGGAGVTIPRNTTMRSAGIPPDPNAAAADPRGFVLATYNTGISYSTNGGQTFTDVNLTSPQPGNPSRTSFFPQSDGGLCCDQVVVYLPGPNLFVWLLQYNPVVNASNVITTPDRLRIAWATPAAAAADFWNAWTWVDLTGTSVAGVSDGLGIASNEWLDYPDLAWSDTFLYVGIDQGFPTPGLVYTGRRIVVRLNLAEIADPTAPSVHYNFARLTGSNGLNKTHFVQGAPGRMVVGSLDNSSTLRVFTWKDSEGSISNSTVGISQIQQGTSYTSTAPDGSDWVGVSFPGNITGGVYRNVATGLGTPPRAEYMFAFDAGVNGGGRPRSYVRLETLTPSGNNYQAFAEYDIWNNDYAFAMAALGTDGFDVALKLAVGGGTVGYPQGTVGFKDDFVVYQVTNSNATQISRFGDYFCARLIPGNDRLFAAEAYDVILNPLPPGTSSGTCATVGCTARMRFVEFGRPPVIIN